MTHDSPRDLSSNAELRLPQDRVKYAMLGSSVVVVGTSIASYDLMHASWCCRGGPLPRPRSLLTITPCCGGPLPRPRPLRTITPLNDSPRDLPSNAELRLPQDRVKYAMLGSSEVVVGTSIASYDLMHHGAVAVRCRAPAPS